MAGTATPEPPGSTSTWPNTGITTAIDPHGRGTFATPRHVRAAFSFPYDYRTDITFYTRHGDWFAWLCAIATLSFLLVSFTNRSTANTRT